MHDHQFTNNILYVFNVAVSNADTFNIPTRRLQVHHALIFHTKMGVLGL